MYGRGLAWFLNASDDMVTGRNDAGSSAVRNFTATGNESRISNTYRNFYKIVQRANNIILNVPEMEISEGVKNRVLGEAYFIDRKSTRLNSSHVKISYAVFCLKKKRKKTQQ